MAKRFLECVVTGEQRRARPEEKVRQHIARWLLDIGYSRDDMQLEYKIRVFSKNVKADIAIFRRSAHDRYSRSNIFMIIECKKSNLPENGFIKAEQQLESYLAAVLRAEYGMVTDGRNTKVIRKGYEHGLDDWKIVPVSSGVPHPNELWRSPMFSLAHAAQLVSKSDPLSLPTHSIEQHAAMSADIAHRPERIAEILTQYGLNAELKRRFDHEYGKQVATESKYRLLGTAATLRRID